MIPVNIFLNVKKITLFFSSQEMAHLGQVKEGKSKQDCITYLFLQIQGIALRNIYHSGAEMRLSDEKIWRKCHPFLAEFSRFSSIPQTQHLWGIWCLWPLSGSRKTNSNNRTSEALETGVGQQDSSVLFHGTDGSEIRWKIIFYSTPQNNI